ncbi:3-hydroxyacyl-CoA dehydrogenase family protein [Ferruginibacter sp. SUN106]|uniref:3-hydroxyacyl-CoA dehydrogenase family protein n=1 Tax=Ferruginibacter sp. SUN106 TaxID=2978348 RepID=UPI003D366987
MKIVALADDEQWNALIAGNTAVEWIRAGENFSFDHYTDAAAFFMLQQNAVYDFTITATPVFINSVITTLQELNTPVNVLRINGWQGFMQRPVWEIAGIVDDNIKTIAEKISKKIIPVKDKPGLVAAKIIAMIINEAYFALGEDVSTTNEIDIAMKLGTNYPYGPFEWAEKMGIKNIFTLLQKLSLSDSRYKPAPALLAATQNN